MFVYSSTLNNAMGQVISVNTWYCNVYWENTKCISDCTHLPTHRFLKNV